jgi:hypothetical protein
MLVDIRIASSKTQIHFLKRPDFCGKHLRSIGVAMASKYGFEPSPIYSAEFDAFIEKILDDTIYVIEIGTDIGGSYIAFGPQEEFEKMS